MISLNVNGQTLDVDADPETPLLWVLRDQLNLKGTKYSCGAGLCGACTVLVDGEATRSCIRSVEGFEGTKITTIEGLGDEDGELSPVQQAWREMSVPQCGYCQSGFIIAATRLLSETADPTDEDIENAVTNLCRCGTYERVRKAIKRAATIARDR